MCICVCIYIEIRSTFLKPSCHRSHLQVVKSSVAELGLIKNEVFGSKNVQTPSEFIYIYIYMFDGMM